MSYRTDDALLTIDDIKRLRDKYNKCGEPSNFSFMHELFHGLDGIIDNLEQSTRDCQRLEDRFNTAFKALTQNRAEINDLHTALSWLVDGKDIKERYGDSFDYEYDINALHNARKILNRYSGIREHEYE